jgi:hypothetical protein
VTVKIRAAHHRALDIFFFPAEERGAAWVGWAWVGVLFLAGLLLWGYFLNFGAIPFHYLDWAEISAARIAFVRDAVLKGALPLHMPDASALRNVTDRFLAIPDVSVSPQMVLLRFLSVGTYVYANTVFLFALGLWGLWVLRRKLSLSLASFTVLALLFNFNGYITAHFSVGHVNYAGGYFLFPWVVVLVIDMLRGDTSWWWVARTALLLFGIFLQGAFNQFVWILFFLALIAVFSWKYIPQVLKAGTFALLLSMVRILPPTLELSKFDNDFLSGYPTLLDFFKGLTVIVLPEQALGMRSPLNPLGWWELDLYIGAAGTAFLLFFGIILWARYRKDADRFDSLFVPLAVIFVFSFGMLYKVFHVVHIPLLDAVRVSARMVSLVFVFVLVAAGVTFQRWLDAGRPAAAVRLGFLALLALEAGDLWQHLKVWRVMNAVKAFPVAPVDVAIKVVSNHPDAPYTGMLILGGSVSLLALVFLVYAVLVLDRRTKRPV